MPSVALTVIEKLPVTVGVPVTTPAEVSVTPAGREPLLIVKLTAPIVLAALKVYDEAGVSGTWIVPVELLGLVTVMVWQLMTSG